MVVEGPRLGGGRYDWGATGWGARCAGSGGSLTGVIARTVVLGRQTSGRWPQASLTLGQLRSSRDLCTRDESRQTGELSSSASSRSCPAGQRIAVAPREQQPRAATTSSCTTAHRGDHGQRSGHNHRSKYGAHSSIAPSQTFRRSRGAASLVAVRVIRLK